VSGVTEAGEPAGSVVLHREGAVITVVINRPRQHNSLDSATKTALRDALEQVATDASVRAVVLTGTGSAFCVGQDLAEHAQALGKDPATAFDTVDEHYARVVTALVTMAKPVVAAVNGTCVGAGLALALACDLRVLASTARLGTAFTAIGLTCDSGLSATLVQAVGRSRASELVLLGEMFTAEQALAWGISGQLAQPDETLTRAKELAQQLASGPTRAYAESKALLHAGSSTTLLQALAAESAAQHRLGLTSDHQDAVAAFLDKQRPRFTGG
jgi:2-(1,2-epoxy-1,2-dihydrophenyl)acetyl-CoA isomerase